MGYSQPTNINYCSSQAAEEWILLGQIPKSLKIGGLLLFFTCINQYSLRLVVCKRRGAALRLERRWKKAEGLPWTLEWKLSPLRTGTISNS